MQNFQTLGLLLTRHQGPKSFDFSVFIFKWFGVGLEMLLVTFRSLAAPQNQTHCLQNFACTSLTTRINISALSEISHFLFCFAPSYSPHLCIIWGTNDRPLVSAVQRHPIDMKNNSSEISVNIYRTIQYYIPDDNILQQSHNLHEAT
jgi:hypothetical protein